MKRANKTQQKLEEKRARKAAVAAETIESGEATGSEEPGDGADTEGETGP